MNDDVTVVITCLDYGSYLEEAVGSALAQQGGPPAVVVVDDGSTDPLTLDVLGRLPPQVTVLRQENRGVAAARNAGLAHATTPFLFVLDADDRLVPEALALLRPALEREPQAGFSYGHLRFFGARSGVVRFPPYDPYRLLYRHIVGVSALMRRQVFEDTGGFDPAFPHYEDWELWVNALAHGWRGVQVDAVAVEYRSHSRSKFGLDRRQYRRHFRQLREKHAALYARGSAPGRDSALGPAERAAYRYFWGLRPVPARLEQALYSLLWRGRGGEESA